MLMWCILLTAATVHRQIVPRLRMQVFFKPSPPPFHLSSYHIIISASSIHLACIPSLLYINIPQANFFFLAFVVGITREESRFCYENTLNQRHKLFNEFTFFPRWNELKWKRRKGKWAYTSNKCQHTFISKHNIKFIVGYFCLRIVRICYIL